MKEEEEELEKEDVVVGWEPMGLRRRRLAMILTEKEKEEERIEFEIQRKKERKSERERGSKGRASRGFVLQRAPAAFQAGLTLCPSGSLAGVLSRWQLRHRDFSSPGYPSRHHPYRSLCLCLPPFLFGRLFASIGCCARKHSASLSNGTIVAIRIRCYCRRMRRISVHDRQWSD